MKATITLETKDVRKIIAKFLGIAEDKVIPSRYSYGVAGMTVEEITAKINGKADNTVDETIPDEECELCKIG